jgi:NAD(P)-dependent dehydrogenase (short-subunit alcohol dehydrogenase family)
MDVNQKINLSNMFGLENKTAIIIGGGHGIGLSTALKLAEVGCGTAIVDLDVDRANNAAAKVANLGRKTVAIQGNVLSDTEMERIMEEAEHKMGGIDVLVAIVGEALITPSLSITPEQWDSQQQLNLRYTFFAAQKFAQRRIARGQPGAIVFISSISGLRSGPAHAPYGAAKAGVANLVGSLATEWAQYGIRVNAVAPGLTNTPRMKPVFARSTAMVDTIPFKRPAETDEIANVVLFLSSDLASYVSGVTIPVDGAWMANNTIGLLKILK